jgi:hypothetical protein
LGRYRGHWANKGNVSRVWPGLSVVVSLTPSEQARNVPVAGYAATRDFADGFVDGVKPPFCFVGAGHGVCSNKTGSAGRLVGSFT